MSYSPEQLAKQAYQEHYERLHQFFVDGCVVGAVSFGKDDSGYFLDWVYIEPEYRRMGMLKRAWSEFIDQYGDFSVSTPLSDAMKQFLLKYGTEKQKGLL